MTEAFAPKGKILCQKLMIAGDCTFVIRQKYQKRKFPHILEGGNPPVTPKTGTHVIGITYIEPNGINQAGESCTKHYNQTDNQIVINVKMLKNRYFNILYRV